MKRLVKYWCLFIVFIVCGCSNDKFVGTWHYSNVSSVNGGTTEVTFKINSNKECVYHMKYTLSSKKIIDDENKCTWEKRDDYIVYVSNGEEGYLLYDQETDNLYTLNKNTKDKVWKFNRG